MSKKQQAVVRITPFEEWSKRFNYTPPPVPVKGPNSELDGLELTGTHPYCGPSLRTRNKRKAKGRTSYTRVTEMV